MESEKSEEEESGANGANFQEKSSAAATRVAFDGVILGLDQDLILSTQSTQFCSSLLTSPFHPFHPQPTYATRNNMELIEASLNKKRSAIESTGGAKKKYIRRGDLEKQREQEYLAEQERERKEKEVHPTIRGGRERIGTLTYRENIQWTDSFFSSASQPFFLGTGPETKGRTRSKAKPRKSFFFTCRIFSSFFCRLYSYTQLGHWRIITSSMDNRNPCRWTRRNSISRRF